MGHKLFDGLSRFGSRKKEIKGTKVQKFISAVLSIFRSNSEWHERTDILDPQETVLYVSTASTTKKTKGHLLLTDKRLILSLKDDQSQTFHLRSVTSIEKYNVKIVVPPAYTPLAGTALHVHAVVLHPVH